MTAVVREGDGASMGPAAGAGVSGDKTVGGDARKEGRNMADGSGWKKGSRLKFEVITPEEAKGMLSRVLRQRSRRPTRVAQLTRAFKDGSYKPSGDPIAIGPGPEFSLLNGQHRLSGIVEADVPWEFAVWRDCPLDAIFDVGAKRTNADRATFDGRANPREWASIVGMAFGLWSTSSPSYEEIEDAAEMIGGGVAWAASAMSTHRRSVTAPLMAGLALVHAVNPGKVEALFSAIIGDGAGLPKGPELLARNYVNAQKGRHDRDGRAHALLVAIWLGRNACVRGTSSRVPGVGSAKLKDAVEWLADARVKKGVGWRRPAWLDREPTSA